MILQTVITRLARTQGTVSRCLSGAGYVTRRRLATFSEGEEKDFLSQFRGGSVDLKLDNSAGLAHLVLNHPEKKNALSGSMMIELRDAVTELEKWREGKGVIMRGEGGTFCSGGDLNLMSNIMDPVKGARMCQFMQNTMMRFQNLPLVSVALIQGKALGGGAELTASCDFRLITEKGGVGFVQVRMGVSPGWAGGASLVQILGRTKALELLVSGKILIGQNAVDFGLVNKVLVEDEKVLANTQDWLLQTVRGVPYVSQALKKVVLVAIDNDQQTALDKEREIFASVWSGPAQVDALKQNVKHK
eukprot:GHVU01227078.1.p1 GENE.GHVU01227078.1~~GHVU01227078.1.p1  ORF type:complete len:303 (+),score=30.58 GHVU01227078.1:101-1009(+)